MTASRLYGKELSSLGYGLALWKPEPQLRDGPIRVADVGYVRDGAFRRLFNAKALQQSDINQRGVPVDFRPIALHDSEIVEAPGDLAAQIYTSESISRSKVSLEASSDVPVSGMGWHFSCAKEHGAVLAVNPAATYRGSDQIGVFKRYFQKNWRSWYHFAAERGLDLQPDEIILVYGLHQTASWANACFTSKDESVGITLKGGLSPVAQAGLSLHGSWSHRTSVEHRSGPVQSRRFAERIKLTRKVPEMNQTVFIKSIQMIMRLGLIKTIRAAAEPRDDTLNDDDDDNTLMDANPRSLSPDYSDIPLPSSRALPELEDGSVVKPGYSSNINIDPLVFEDVAIEIQAVPEIQRAPLPCDDVLRYMLETSVADYAIASDDEAKAFDRWLGAQYRNSSEFILASPPAQLAGNLFSVEVVDDGCGMQSAWNIVSGPGHATMEHTSNKQEQIRSASPDSAGSPAIMVSHEPTGNVYLPPPGPPPWFSTISQTASHSDNAFHHSDTAMKDIPNAQEELMSAGPKSDALGVFSTYTPGVVSPSAAKERHRHEGRRSPSPSSPERKVAYDHCPPLSISPGTSVTAPAASLVQLRRRRLTRAWTSE